MEGRRGAPQGAREVESAFTWTTAIQLLGAAAGLAALAALVGGAMLWIRFDALDLPADHAVALLPSELLVTVGAHALLGPLLAAVAVLFVVVVIDPLDGEGRIRPLRLTVIVVLLAVVAFLVLLEQAWDMETKLAAVATATAIAAFAAIVCTAWRGTRVRWIAWMVFAACAVFGAALAVLRTLDDPRLEPVAVLLAPPADSPADAAPTGVAGFYVGETGDRLYLVPLLGNGDPTHPFADADPNRLIGLQRDDVERVLLREPVGIAADDPGRDQAHTLLFDLLQGNAATVERAEPVDSRRPAVDFAPLVHLHAREDWYPMSARGFLGNSVLTWSNQPDCTRETIAAGKAVAAANPTLEALDPLALGGHGARPYQRAPDGPNCDPPTPPVSFFSNQLTRPFESTGRLPRLPLQQGFYLDLSNGARVGRRKPSKEGALTFLRDVPVYVERTDEQIGRRPGLRLTYWMLYGLSEPPGPHGVTRLLVHEGDWEAISVLLRREGPRSYLPISVRYNFHNERRNVPWTAVKRAAAGTAAYGSPRLRRLTHPVVYSARGSHASYWRAGSFESEVRSESGRRHFAVDDAAMACPACPQWETWKLVRDARKQPWYGFGGAWGKVGASGGTTGPLGPSRYKLD